VTGGGVRPRLREIGIFGLRMSSQIRSPLAQGRAASLDDQASVVTSTILGFGLGILDVFTKVRPEKPNPSRCMKASVER
jgi:hypothetical protein